MIRYIQARWMDGGNVGMKETDMYCAQASLLMKFLNCTDMS